MRSGLTPSERQRRKFDPTHCMLGVYFFVFNANERLQVYPYTFSAERGAFCPGIYTKCSGELHEYLNHFISADLDVYALMNRH